MFEYKCFGNSSKPTLIFLHGFMGDYLDFLPIINRLKNNFYCVGINLPGHGNTPLYSSQSFDTTIACLQSFIQQRFQAKFIYGYSQGGRLALELAIRYNTYQKLIIESSSFGLKSKQEIKNRMISDSKLLKDISNKEDYLIFLQSWYGQEIFHPILNLNSFKCKIKEKSRHIGKKKIKLFQKALLSLGQTQHTNLQERLISSLKEKRFHLHYIVGEKDNKYLKISKLLEDRSFASRSVINGFGHNCHYANSIQVAKIIENTLYSRGFYSR